MNKSMNKKYFILHLIFIIVFVILLANLIAFYIAIDKGTEAFPAKVVLGDTNTFLEYPWGQNPNLNIYIDLNNVSINDKEYYVYQVLLAMKWWEINKNYNLSYDINFTRINNSDKANIIIMWNDIIYNNTDVGGTTHINSSGMQSPDQMGENFCDAYSPPFKRCIIEIQKNLTYDTNFYVIKHEIGHALGLKHSFNKSDFLILYLGFNPNYRFDIMFDNGLLYC